MRIVIGEDSALFREGLARLLEDAGHEVVGTAGDAPTLVDAVDETRPYLAVVDIRMPPDGTDDGARAARTLRERHPGLGIVLLSQHIEARHSVALVAGGWSDICSRTASPMSTTSWTHFVEWPSGAPRSTTKSSRLCSDGATRPTYSVV